MDYLIPSACLPNSQLSPLPRVMHTFCLSLIHELDAGTNYFYINIISVWPQRVKRLIIAFPSSHRRARQSASQLCSQQPQRRARGVDGTSAKIGRLLLATTLLIIKISECIHCSHTPHSNRDAVVERRRGR